jgi:AraC-like DNA-binding protein
VISPRRGADRDAIPRSDHLRGAGVAHRPVVLAAVRDPEWRQDVRIRLDAWSSVVFVEDVHQLPLAATQNPPDIVLWHLDRLLDVSAEAYTATFQRLRRVSPCTAVIAYAQVDRAVASLVLIAGRVGVDRLLLRGYDDLELGLRDIWSSTRIDTAIRGALVQLDIPPGSAALAFTHCFRRASTGSITVADWASELHVNRKTLSLWLHAVGLPTPEPLIGWCRVCGVALALADPRRSVARSARMLGFSSPTDLRRMVSRYVGCTPTEMRLAGGVTMVLSRLRAQMTVRRSPESSINV